VGIIRQLREEHAKVERKLQNRHPLMLLIWFTGYLATSFLLGSLSILYGWGSVWVHTQPEPTSASVNFSLIWMFILLFWGYAMRVQYVIGMSGLPDESILRHRTRIVLLHGHKLMWMALTAESILTIIKIIVWWASWR